MEEFPAIFFIVFFASIIQSGTGFGFSILSMPFLLFFYMPQQAILLNISLSLFLSIIMAFKLYRNIDRKLLLQLITGSIIGFLPGLVLFSYLNVSLLKLLIGTIILLFSILFFFRFQIKLAKTKSMAVGGISALLTSSLGIPGPPLLIYFSAANIDKHIVRSTSLCFFILVYTVSLGLHLFLKDTPEEDWLIILYSLPLVLLGTALGEALFKKLNQEKFKKLLYIILAATGILTIASVI